MNNLPEPMTTFDADEWRAYKRATRNLKYRQRMEQVKASANVTGFTAWLAAVERDDLTDPAERERRQEQTVIGKGSS
jgi:hypothetical protein